MFKVRVIKGCFVRHMKGKGSEWDRMGNNEESSLCPAHQEHADFMAPCVVHLGSSLFGLMFEVPLLADC